MRNFSVKPRKQHQTPSAGAAALPGSPVCPAPHRRNSSGLTRRVKPEDALVPASAAILSSSPACGRSCAALSPCRALSFINSLGAIPLPWLLIWLEVMGGGGRGRGCPFFCFLNWGLPVCHFLLCILSLQSGSIMIAHYVNIKDNCRALIKAISVSFPPSLPHSSRLSQEHNKLNQLPQIMHA